MNRFTNYAIRRARDGTVKVILEIKGERTLLQCKHRGKFFYVIPRCVAPSALTEKEAQSIIGKPAKGLMKSIYIEPYEVACFHTKEVFLITYCFGFIPKNKSDPIGITPVSEHDICT